MGEPPLLYERYRLQRKLGSGGFATVYLADDLRMGRPVAIKVIEDARDLDGRALREAQAAAKLDHPHIVTVHEVTREATRTLLFTEYVEGRTLRELYAGRRLTDREILEVGVQMCRALEHAHRRGVVHRDVKPENVMLVDGDGIDVRIMDFGVAQLEDLGSITAEGDLVGTLAYMAPEQLAGGPVDARADVYALGLVLHEGLTGLSPRREQKGADLTGLTAVTPALSRRRPDLPPVLHEALTGALQTKPTARLDAAGLRRMLERAVRHLPEPEREPGLTERAGGLLRDGVRRQRLAYIGTHLTAGALALATTAYFLPRISFYPPGWIVPMVAGTAFITLLAPSFGGGLALAVLFFPILAFAPGWGVVYLAITVPFFGVLVWRTRAWAGLLPGLAPLLGAGWAGLALLPLGGYFLRRWGPVAGFLGGLTLALAIGFEGWATMPYVFSEGAGRALLGTRHVARPGEVLTEVARFLDLRPELLLQAGVFALFSLPPQWFLRGGRRRRLWFASAYLALLFCALLLVPPLLLDVQAHPEPLAVAMLPVAIIMYLLAALLAPSEGPGGSEG